MKTVKTWFCKILVWVMILSMVMVYTGGVTAEEGFDSSEHGESDTSKPTVIADNDSENKTEPAAKPEVNTNDQPDDIKEIPNETMKIEGEAQNDSNQNSNEDTNMQDNSEKLNTPDNLSDEMVKEDIPKDDAFKPDKETITPLTPEKVEVNEDPIFTDESLSTGEPEIIEEPIYTETAGDKDNKDVYYHNVNNVFYPVVDIMDPKEPTLPEEEEEIITETQQDEDDTNIEDDINIVEETPPADERQDLLKENDPDNDIPDEELIPIPDVFEESIQIPETNINLLTNNFELPGLIWGEVENLYESLLETLLELLPEPLAEPLLESLPESLTESLPDVNVFITIKYDEANLRYGSLIKLIGHLSGCDELAYSLMWIKNTGEGWVEIPGVDGLEYSFILDEQNFSHTYRLLVLAK